MRCAASAVGRRMHAADGPRSPRGAILGVLACAGGQLFLGPRSFPPAAWALLGLPSRLETRA
jgi:hypothetical protein